MPPKPASLTAVLPPVTERKIVHPRLSVVICGLPTETGVSADESAKIVAALDALGLSGLIAYAPPLTAIDAMSLMGMEVEEKGVSAPFGEEYLFEDFLGRKVRCSKNVKNRPVNMGSILAYEEDVLNRRWELNGEPVIVGDDDTVLNGQHQLIALYRAQQRRDFEKHLETRELVWANKWPAAPGEDRAVVTISKIVVYGVKNTDQVVNTMDTCRPRSFSDVLFRSPYFANLPPRSSDGCDRLTAATITDKAVKDAWRRTGVGSMATSTRQTNAAGVSWVESHGGAKGKFVEAIREIMEADKKTGAGRRLSPLIPGGVGAAADILWLMMASGTPNKKVEVYFQDEDRSDRHLKYDKALVKKALEFWAEVGKREPVPEGATGRGKPTGTLRHLTAALDALQDMEDQEAEAGETVVPRDPERHYLICLAWTEFAAGDPVTPGVLNLKDKYTPPDKQGRTEFLKVPVLGGIDLGFRGVPRVHAPHGGTQLVEPPTVEEINGAAHEIRTGNTDATRDPVSEPVPNGHSPAVNGALNLGSDNRPLMEQALERLHTDHPDLGPILCRDSRGNYDVWGDIECGMVKGPLGREPSLHPSRMLRIQVKAEEFEQVIDALTAKGVEMTVGVANKVDGVWQIISTIRPAKKKAPRGKKETG